MAAYAKKADRSGTRKTSLFEEKRCALKNEEEKKVEFSRKTKSRS